MFKSATLVLFAAALGARAAINVSTPADAAQCSSLEFNANGDTPGPYYAYVMKSDQPCGDPVSQEITIDASGNFKWTAPTAGRYVVVVDNGDGTVEGWSNSFNINDAGISNCAEAASAPTTSTTASTTAHGTTLTTGRGATSVPINAAQTTGGVADDSQTGGASRSAVGGFTALTLLGAVAAALSF